MSSSRGSEVLIAVLLSATVWPGAGQLRNGEKTKGVVTAVVTGCLVLAFSLRMALDLAFAIGSTGDPTLMLSVVGPAVRGDASVLLGLILLLGLVWTYSAVDAYFSARRKALRSGSSRARVGR